jgi:RNA polymerase sigma-70 factor (ECF subfamily)
LIANLLEPSASTGNRVQPTDEELMDAVTRGDSSALRPLVERHHAPLLAFLYRMVAGDRHLAEDLVQETFLRLIRQRTYSRGRPFKPWLYAIATNLARDQFRSRPSSANTAIEMLDVEDPRPGPERRALESEARRVVMRALGELPHEYRATILLRFFQDLSLNDIAQALDVPLGTVKSRLSVGTRKLRDLLEHAGFRE